MRRRSLIAATAFAMPAAAAPPLVVVELFTSQSCDSCPPADAVLRELAQRSDVLPLSWHVTYWNNLGWRDRFSLPEATERQRRYSATLPSSAYGAGRVYTPQAVVQGGADAVGHNRNALNTLIRAAAANPAIAVALRAEGEGLLADIPAGPARGTLWLVGFDREHTTPVASGENRGRSLTHANVVRSVEALGVWQGEAWRLSRPRPLGERTALLLQAADGRILGAARV